MRLSSRFDIVPPPQGLHSCGAPQRADQRSWRRRKLEPDGGATAVPASGDFWVSLLDRGMTLGDDGIPAPQGEARERTPGGGRAFGRQGPRTDGERGRAVAVRPPPNVGAGPDIVRSEEP